MPDSIDDVARELADLPDCPMELRPVTGECLPLNDDIEVTPSEVVFSSLAGVMAAVETNVQRLTAEQMDHPVVRWQGEPIHSTLMGQDVVEMRPGPVQVAVMGPDGRQMGTTNDPEALYDRLYEQLRADIPDANAARQAAIESFRSIMNISRLDADQLVNTFSPPPPEPGQLYIRRDSTVQSFGELRPPDNAWGELTIDHNRTWGSMFIPTERDYDARLRQREEEIIAQMQRDDERQGLTAPPRLGRGLEIGPWTYEPTTNVPMYLDKANETIQPAVEDMTKQDFKILVQIVNDTTDNLLDLMNEKLSAAFDNGQGVEGDATITREQVVKLIANQFGDHLDGKYKFDRKKFLIACGVEN